MKYVKTPLLVIGAIAVLTALMLTFLEPPGQSPAESSDEESATPADRNEHPPPRRTQSSLGRFAEPINQASNPDEFRAAAGLILEEAPPDRAVELLEHLLERWLTVDVPSALAFAAGLDAGDGRERLLKYAVLNGGKTDFATVIEWLEDRSLPDEIERQLFELLYGEPANAVPSLALEHIDSLPAGQLKKNMVRKLTGLLARQDPAAVLEWLNDRLPLDDEPLQRMHESLFSALMETDFEQAGELIQNMPVSERKHSLARQYADQLAGEDVPAALAWSRTLTDPESYRTALSAAYEAWLSEESDKTVILEELLGESDSDFRNHLINEVALDVASAEPAALADVVEQLPASAQGEVASKVVRFWTARAPEEAAAWTARLDAGPAKDQASKALVDHYALEGDRDRLIASVAAIGDDELQHETAKQAAAQWSNQSPEEARELLDNMPFLSDSEREAILADLE